MKCKVEKYIDQKKKKKEEKERKTGNKRYLFSKLWYFEINKRKDN